MSTAESIFRPFLDIFYYLFMGDLYWYESVGCVAQGAAAAWFCCRYLGFKSGSLKPLKYAVFIAALSVNNLIFTAVWQYRRIPLNFNLVICLLFCLIFLKGKFWDKLFTSLIPIFAHAIVNLICVKSFSLAMDKTEDSKYVWFFSVLGFFLVCALVLKLQKKAFSLTTGQWILQISCFGISLAIVSIMRTMTYFDSADDAKFLAIFILIAALNVLLYIIMLIMQKAVEDKAEKTALQTELNNRKSLIAESDARYKEMRILRHDMKHYLTTAVELLSEDQPQKAREYLEEMLNEKLDSSQCGVNTGHSVIDATLTGKQKLCGMKNIGLKMVIDREIGDVSEMDLGIVFSNLFDNAIAACEKTANPLIFLSMRLIRGNLVVEMKNTIEKSVLKANPGLATTASDKENHGLGISSIRTIAEKYQGFVSFSEEGGFFSALVLLRSECQPR